MRCLRDCWMRGSSGRRSSGGDEKLGVVRARSLSLRHKCGLGAEARRANFALEWVQGCNGSSEKVLENVEFQSFDILADDKVQPTLDKEWRRRKVAVWRIWFVCIGAFILASGTFAEYLPGVLEWLECKIMLFLSKQPDLPGRFLLKIRGMGQENGSALDCKSSKFLTQDFFFLPRIVADRCEEYKYLLLVWGLGAYAVKYLR
ncbi:hypothetical protein Droror1_Dr00012047 [Drosera rotundifolia]